MDVEMEFNPLSLEFTQDPQTVYSYFRDNKPVAWVESFQAYLLTRYDDVKLATSDTRFTTDKRVWSQYEPSTSTGHISRDFVIESSPFVAEGDLHRAARRILPKTFSPRAIEKARVMINEVVKDYFSPLREAVKNPGTEIDLVGLVQPIPNSVMARLLCVDEIDVKEADFVSIAKDYLKCVNPFLGEEDLEKADRAAETVINMFRELIALRKMKPGEDIVSRLLKAAEEDESVVSEDSVLALLTTIMIVGSDTTVYQTLLIFKNLLENPELIQLIKDEPEQLETVYTELLRKESVGKILLRYAREDIPLRGEVIKKGAMVFLPAAAANGDPRAFENPQHIDINRDLGNSLHFGHGIHYCLGAHLAKAELEVMINEFVSLVGTNFTYNPESIEWNPENFTVREISSLPVSLL